MIDIPNCYYRLSVKALVLNEARDAFLLIQEPDGHWDLPGGGLDWGTRPQDDLKREIVEEMGIEASHIAQHPAYFFTFINDENVWMGNVLYEVTLSHFNITPSDECIATAFIDNKNTEKLNICPNIEIFLPLFTPQKHT